MYAHSLIVNHFTGISLTDGGGIILHPTNRVSGRMKRFLLRVKIYVTSKCKSSPNQYM